MIRQHSAADKTPVTSLLFRCTGSGYQNGDDTDSDSDVTADAATVGTVTADADVTENRDNGDDLIPMTT